VAAARHISIMYGSAEIDGHAFCLGLDSLGMAFEKQIMPVVFLIRGAIFRSRQTVLRHERLSPEITSLGGLIDMYHAHQAERIHDKVYALLGMCSDNLKGAGLEPDYKLGWDVLMHRLVKFILGDQVSVDTWVTKEMAFIKSKGCILGEVSQVKSSTAFGGGQSVNFTFKSSPKEHQFTLPNSAISVREGDIICLLQGTSKPTIIRLREDHFLIIIIAVVPLDQDKRLEDTQSVSFTRDFSLIWNWNISAERVLNPKEYNDLINGSAWGSEIGIATQLRHATRALSVAQILEDLGMNDRAKKMLQEVVKRYGKALGEEYSDTSYAQLGLTLLTLAAEKGHEDVVKKLLEAKSDVESKDKDNRTRCRGPPAKGTRRSSSCCSRLNPTSS
jgi:hypothetical protein